MEVAGCVTDAAANQKLNQHPPARISLVACFIFPPNNFGLQLSFKRLTPALRCVVLSGRGGVVARDDGYSHLWLGRVGWVAFPIQPPRQARYFVRNEWHG